MGATTPDAAADQLEWSNNVEWLELFFDLVVIAAIALLAHSLREHLTWGGLGMFLVMYAAIWMTWVNVVLYADIAGEQTRVRTVLTVMLLIAVMAAANPAHHESRANAFAIAFLLARGFLSRRANRTGRMLNSWPLLQFGGFAIPWFASIWVDAPWKYWLWALAVAVDLALALAMPDSAAQRRFEDYKARYEDRIERFRNHHADDPRRIAMAEDRVARMPDIVAVEVDHEHLDERLGLLVIVVLGEAVTQLVSTAAGADWTRPLVVASVAGFLVLVGLWGLAFAFGFTAAPGARLGTMPPRYGLPLHLLTTLGLLLLAAGLGEFVARPDRTPDGMARWLVCGGLALHFAVSLLSGLVAGASRRWLLAYALPALLLSLGIGAVAPMVSPQRFALLLIVPVAWQVWFAANVLRRVGDPSAAATSPPVPPPAPPAAG